MWKISILWLGKIQIGMNRSIYNFGRNFFLLFSSPDPIVSFITIVIIVICFFVIFVISKRGPEPGDLLIASH